MRVILDECLPRKLGRFLTDHDVATMPEAGHAGKKNGELLPLIAGHFDVFVTVDANLPSQQNLKRWALGVVVVRAWSNRLQDLMPLVPEIASAISLINAHEVIVVGGKGSK